MNLLHLTGAFAKWYGAAFGTVLRFQPGNALLLIVSKVLYLITTVLARLLPIKAILLVGSPGVPRYFQAIIPPDRKMEALVVLAIASVVAYAGSFALEAAIARLSRSGSRAVVSRANDIVLSDQLEAASVHYDRLASIAANLTFGVVAVVVLAIAAPPVLWTVLIAIVTAYAVAAIALYFGDTHRQGSLAHAIVNHLGTFLSVGVVLAFIACFVVILWPFLTGGEAQVLLAIISVVLVRRLMGVLTGVIKIGRALFDRALHINQLFLRAHKQEAAERPDWRILRDTYAVAEREASLRSALPGVFGADAPLRTSWMDPVAGVQRQRIDVDDGDGGVRTFLERVYPLSARHRLDSETYLLGKVRPEVIGAPRPVGEFQHGPFISQVSLCGRAMAPVTRENALHCQAVAIGRLWSVVLPPELISAYTTTHRFLHERLNVSLVSRASLAADSAHAEQISASFLAELPSLRARLERLPLVLVNPDLAPRNLMAAPDGPPVVLDWSRWAIEPLGAANGSGNGARLQALVEQIKRPDVVSDDALMTGILFASTMALLEKALLKQRYRTAVELMEAILANDPQAQYLAAHDEDEDDLENAAVA